MLKGRKRHLLLAVLVLALFPGLVFALQSTYDDFREGSYENVYIDQEGDFIAVDETGFSRWTSTVLDSQRNGTTWLNVEWFGDEPDGTDVSVRALSSTDFTQFGSVEGSDTTLSSWESGELYDYDYIDYRTDSQDLLDVSIRGLDFDLDQQPADLYYAFEGSSNSIKDFSGNGISGSIEDSNRRVDGYSGIGISFDGTQNFEVPEPNPALTNEAGSMTVGMWVNPDDLSGERTLIDKENEFQLNLENNGEIWVRTYGDNNQGTVSINENEWTHIGVRWVSNDYIRVYIDGQQVDERSIDDISETTDNSVYFGSTFDNQQNYNGIIDEIRVYRNESDIQFMTDITDFTDTARPSGEKVSSINSEYVQARYKPENVQNYEVEQTRVASNSTFGDWRESGERMDNVPNNRYAVFQLNLTENSSGSSPQIEEARMLTATPDEIEMGTTTGMNQIMSDNYRDIAVSLSLNRTGIESLEPVEAEYTFWNLRTYCEYNPETGYCEQVEGHNIDTEEAQLFVSNQPLYRDLSTHLEGSTRFTGTFEFTTPHTWFLNRDFQLRQEYSIDGEERSEMSNPVIDSLFIGQEEEGDSCRYSMECQEGLYCGDTNSDTVPDTCVSQDQTLQGNMCEDVGSGVKERVGDDGYCQLASSGMENENLLEGEVCDTSTDCVTDYCYDSSGDDIKTCETSPTSGSEDGLRTSTQSISADSCYFAGEVYSSGAEVDLFDDGVTNSCENGRWTQDDVRAVVNYSSVEQDEELQIDYNIHNFKQGYDYQQGYINRLNENNIDLQQIRVDISGESFERSISGNVPGLRNQTGSLTLNMPELNYTEDLTAVTYIEYDYQGTTETLVASPLTGGPYSQRLDTGSCRTGLQTEDGTFCLYSTQEEPGTGTVETEGSTPGQLCQPRTADNMEHRINVDGACEVADRGAENNNLPNSYRCETKEDCANDYCYHSGEREVMTCQTEPTPGSEEGVDAGPQSCDANSCMYEGQCYSEGSSLNGFELQDSMTCEQGEWSKDKDISFKVEVPDQKFEGEVPVDITVHNQHEYCDYTLFECFVIDHNVMDIQSITFSIRDHEPFTLDIDEQIPGEGVYQDTIQVGLPDLDYTNSSNIRSSLQYSFNGTTKETTTPVIPREQTWERRQSGENCIAGYQTDNGYYCLYQSDNEDTYDPSSGEVVEFSGNAGNICRAGGASTEERVSTGGTCELSGPGVENQNLPDGYQCRVQEDCINDYCWDDSGDNIMTCQSDPTTGTEDGNKISDPTDCPSSACDVRDQCYADGASVPLQDQVLTCEDGELREEESTTTQELDETAVQSEMKDMVVEISLNRSDIEVLQPVEAEYTFWNPRIYCEYNPETGYCEETGDNVMYTDDAQLHINNQPLWMNLPMTLQGSTSYTDSFEFTTPSSYWTNRNFQLRQEYTVEGDQFSTVSNPVFDNSTLPGNESGDSCRYSMDCQEGLYCADTVEDGTPDTCLDRGVGIEGNACERIGAGVHERISTDGYCEIASSGMENENLQEGQVCDTSTDCTTNYCYDGNGDDVKTCQTEPHEGSLDGAMSPPRSATGDTCYFAGEVYSSGAEVDLFDDGVTNSCENGRWTQDEVRATVNYSAVEEGETLLLDYNAHNFKQGYSYENGFITRMPQNQIELEQIRVDISGESFEKDISGVVPGLRNQTGSVSIDMPELNYTEDLTAVTYIEYDYQGTTETLVASPLTGGPHSKSLTSGECRTGLQVGDGTFCLYPTEEEPFSTGTVEIEGSTPGQLCQPRTADNMEHRINVDGACEPAFNSAENNNLPNSYQCETKEDCISDYCYDSGSGTKTCQANPTPGSEEGVDAGPQSCNADSCFYEGQCYSEGSSLNGFELQDSMTCEQGEWEMDEEIAFQVDVPDQEISEGELDVGLEVHNPYRYCEYTLFECLVIDDNIMDIQSIAFSVTDHEPFTVDIDEQIPGEGMYQDTLTIDIPSHDYTDSGRIRASLQYSFNGTTMESTTPLITRGQTWQRRDTGQDCIKGFETDSGYYCLYQSNDEDTYDPSSGEVVETSGFYGNMCRSEGAATEERVSTSGYCELSGPGVENQNLPNGYQCLDQDDCIADYCWDNSGDEVMTCQPGASTGSEEGTRISDAGDCPDPACQVRDQCYAAGADVPLGDQVVTCEGGELGDRLEPEVLDPDTPTDLRSEGSHLAVALSLNRTDMISETDPLEATYTFYNTRRHCEYNEDTGYCDEIEDHFIETDTAQLFVNNQPLWIDIQETMYGSQVEKGTFEVVTPATQFLDRSFQLEQRFEMDGETEFSTSNTLFDQITYPRAEEGDSCSYVTDCGPGLYCGDVSGDGSINQCVEQNENLQGNMCEQIGSGVHERVNADGYCEIASSSMQNENLLEGQTCETSTDCVTDYCYDSSGDDIKTCETSPTSGSEDGTKASPQSANADTCYFAGEVYSSGAEKDLLNDGSVNVCENGRWTKDVGATVDYSAIQDDGTLTLDYNIYNFKTGYEHQDGYVNRLDQNDIELEQIRVDIRSENFEETISGTVPGLRNQTGTVTIDVPDINHTTDLTALTYIEYDHQGTTETITASPLTGGPYSERISSGECRTGLQVDDDVFCLYSVEEYPFSEGQAVSTSEESGQLCQTRTADNVEQRINVDGACEVAGQGMENNNLPNSKACNTKEDCISDYCYDSGSGTKTCQANPTPGSESGVDASPQSCEANACSYDGQCFSDGTTVQAFGIQQEMTCEAGRWDSEEDISVKLEVPDQQLEGTVEAELEVHNHYEYCEFNDDVCEIIEDNFVSLEEITFSVKDHEEFTVNLGSQVIEGEGVHTESIEIDAPLLDYTDSSRMRSVIEYTDRDGVVKQSVTPLYTRGDTWKRTQSGQECDAGYETDEGYFCLYSGLETEDFDASDGITYETQYSEGNVCRTGQAATEERVDIGGKCQLSGPGVENENLPDGYQCRVQEDCINDYCWDDSGDNIMTCQPEPTNGTETGNKISDPTDCPSSACNVRDQCYADGASVPFEDQTLVCEDGELRDDVAVPDPTPDQEDPIQATFQNLQYEITDQTESDGTLNVEFTFTNDESDAVTIHDTYITAGDEVSEYRTLEETVQPGESTTFTVSDDKPVNGVSEFMAESRVSSSSIGFDKWKSSDNVCYIAGWDEFQDTCLREDPMVQELTFTDYPTTHEFNISAVGYDPNGADDVVSCEIDIEGEDRDTRMTLNGEIDRDYGDERELLCTYDSVDTSIENFEPNTHVRTILTLTDSEGRTGTQIEGHNIPNRPPTHERPLVEPDPALSGDNLQVFPQDVEDAEGDPITIDYQWTINDQPLPYNQDTLDSGNTTVGDNVKAHVTPSDPWDTGETKYYELTVREANITIVDVEIQDYPDRHAFNVSTVVNSTDVEGTDTCEITATNQDDVTHVLEGDMNKEFGENNQLSCNYTSIDDTIEGFEATDILEIEIYLADENEAVDTWTEFHEIPNRPPSVTEPDIDPTPAVQDRDLTGIHGSVSDPEDDPVTFDYTWYINGNEQPYTGEVLEATNFTVGDEITFVTTPFDGYEFGEPNSTTITIQDIEFIVTDLAFEDHPDAHAFDVSASVYADNIEQVEGCTLEAEDQDGNSHSYQMDVDTSFGGGEEALCTYSSINDSIEGFDVNELIDITVSAHRDTETETVHGQHRIPNRAPVTTEPEITPDPATDSDELTGVHGETFDAEEDPITLQYEWFVQDELVENGNMSTSDNTVLAPENFNEGETVRLDITPHDPYESGDTESTNITIVETDLDITEIIFEDYSDRHAFNASAIISTETQDGPESCELTAEDQEGNSVSVTGEINESYGGNNQAICTYSEFGSSTEGFEVHDEIEVTFTVETGQGSATDSGTHMIPNRAPEAEEVYTSPPGPVDEDNVTLNADITDAEDDPIVWANFTVTHEDGTDVVSNTNGTQVGETWTSPEFSVEPSINYSWSIEMSDGYNTSEETGWFTTTNEPPEITSVDLENVSGAHGFDVSFVVEDPDGSEDIQECSLEATDGEGNIITGSPSIDRSYGGSNEAMCTYSSINDSIEGFEVFDDIEFNLTVTDSVGQEDFEVGEGTIPNRAPEIDLQTPLDDETAERPFNLFWEGTDEDGDSLDYEVVVAEDEEMNNVVVSEQTEDESARIDVEEGEYYWQVTADDSYTTTDSEIRSVTVVQVIENVTITMEGDAEQVYADGEQRTTGTFTDLEFPYIAMDKTTGIEGLVSLGNFLEASYETEDGRDRVSVTQNYQSGRVLMMANDGTVEDIEGREEQISSGSFLSLPLASFTGDIPDQNMVTSRISYTDIDIVGSDEPIVPGVNTEILLRNEGIEDGRVQVRIEQR